MRAPLLFFAAVLISSCEGPIADSASAPRAAEREYIDALLQRINRGSVTSIDQLSESEMGAVRTAYNAYFAGIRPSGFLDGAPERFDEKIARAFEPIARLCVGKTSWHVLDLFGKPVAVMSTGSGLMIEYKITMGSTVGFVCSRDGTVRSIAVGSTGWRENPRTGGALSVHDFRTWELIRQQTPRGRRRVPEVGATLDPSVGIEPEPTGEPGESAPSEIGKE